MSLHDVTKNLQPAPVPTANPWCNAAQKLSDPKRLNNNSFSSSKCRKQPTVETVGNAQKKLAVPGSGKKENNESVELIAKKKQESSNGERSEAIHDSDLIIGNPSDKGTSPGNYLERNGGNDISQRSISENDPESIEDKLKEATNKFQLLQVKDNLNVDVSNNNDGSNGVNSNNNFVQYNSNNNSNANTSHRTYRKKARQNYSPNNRNFIPLTPPSVEYSQPFYQGGYQNSSNNNTSNSALNNNNSAFLNNRWMPMPPYDTPVLPNPMFYPYMRNGFFPSMVDPLGMQQAPIPSRVYYGQQLNETSIQDMRVPMHMVVPNGIPIPISPRLPVYNQQVESANGNMPSSNAPLSTEQTVEDERFNQLIYQIRYYFSVENLCKDMYLRRQMDREGFIPVSLIKGFSRVRTLSGGDSFLVDSAIENIDSIEKRQTDGTEDYRIRVKEGWEKWVLTKGLKT